jgi:hypothetical protein
MSKFFNEVKQVLERSSIKHVKILSKPNTYGYILRESQNGPAMVYVVSSDESGMSNQMIGAAPDDLEQITSDEQDVSSLDIVKQNAIVYLSQKGLLDDNNRDSLEQLVACPCMGTVESFLRKHSLTDSEILNIVRPAIK